MTWAVNTFAHRLRMWQRGRLQAATDLETRTFAQVHPAGVFPRLGRLRLGRAAATQHSTTTCGPAVLGLVNALFDPELLAYLRVEGEELRARARAEVARDRFARVQTRLLRSVTRGGWPAALGTPPWGLARELRVPGVAYQHLPVSDRDPAFMEILTEVLQRASAAGIPVPLYVGGNLATRVASAAPRHVVLLVPPSAMVSPPGTDHARIYDPSSGRVYRRPWRFFSGRTRPDAALGGWQHLAWVVLPR